LADYFTAGQVIKLIHKTVDLAVGGINLVLEKGFVAVSTGSDTCFAH